MFWCNSNVHSTFYRLRSVCLLIDGKVGVKKNDLIAFEMMGEFGGPFQVNFWNFCWLAWYCIVFKVMFSDVSIALWSQKMENQNFGSFGWVIVKCMPYRRLVSSVVRAPVCCAGGWGFEPQTRPTLRVLNNWGECAAFVIISANG